MKNFPDVFPIRYAIIAHSNLSEVSPQTKIAFKRDLVKIISSSRLSPKDLMLSYFIYDAYEYGKVYKFHPKLEWAQSAFDCLNLFYEGDSNAHFLEKSYDLIFLSYQGNNEVPFFHEYFNNKDNPFSYYQNRFGVGIKESTKFSCSIFRDYYDLIMNKKSESAEGNFLSLMSVLGEAISITSCNSAMWKALDRGKNEGILHKRNIFDISEEEKHQVEEKKIEVLLCDSWERLFMEEVWRLYKVSNFCQNCGVALPFNFSGKYCPENTQCKRSRDRIRQKESQTKKKKCDKR